MSNSAVKNKKPSSPHSVKLPDLNTNTSTAHTNDNDNSLSESKPKIKFTYGKKKSDMIKLDNEDSEGKSHMSKSSDCIESLNPLKNIENQKNIPIINETKQFSYNSKDSGYVKEDTLKLNEQISKLKRKSSLIHNDENIPCPSSSLTSEETKSCLKSNRTIDSYFKPNSRIVNQKKKSNICNKIHKSPFKTNSNIIIKSSTHPEPKSRISPSHRNSNNNNTSSHSNSNSNSKSDNKDQVKDSAALSRRPIVYEQLHLEFGQKNFGPSPCETCGMTYSRGKEEDVLMHEKYHKIVVGGIDWPVSKEKKKNL